MTKTCPSCKTEFEGPYQKTYCSDQCRPGSSKERLNKRVREYRARRYKKEGRWRDEGPKAQELKQWMIEIKSEPCTDCKKSFDTCCMDFDHVRGEKKYNVGSMFAHHYSRELIEKELAKCEIVCANCHRIRTRDRKIGSGEYE